MSRPIIEVKGISKAYRLGTIGATSLKDEVERLWIGWQGRSATRKKEEFWALRDVSFEVQPGEVLGIIGRNGAGKSTLLKILSRITQQTAGEVFLRGRVASLLEVGTGFHPDLTGRENIFLNGAILGMTKAEIRRKLDEIIAFAEVEQFIDTPVKRYSSGMYVRLAFAVAAHLEPEILIVDEVLAVGDAQFQKKCLAKMQDVSSNEGRTVLFVSHNMEAVLRLCTKAITIAGGRLGFFGHPKQAVNEHLQHKISSQEVIDISRRGDPALGKGKVKFISASPVNSAARGRWAFSFGKPLSFEFQVESTDWFADVELGIGLFSARATEVASWTSACSQTRIPIQPGSNTLRFTYEELTLVPGQYYLALQLRLECGVEDYIPEAIWFDVVINEDSAQANTQKFGGLIVPKAEAQVLERGSLAQCV